jgi:hypothetical protein
MRIETGDINNKDHKFIVLFSSIHPVILPQDKKMIKFYGCKMPETLLFHTKVISLPLQLGGSERNFR